MWLRKHAGSLVFSFNCLYLFEKTTMAESKKNGIDLLLKDEYFHLQKVVEDFDGKSITIKAWSVTGSLVLIGAGLSEKGSKELFLIGGIASLLFWIIEAYWKAYQLSYYPRIKDIERYFSNPESQVFAPFQIYHEWMKSYVSFNKKRIHKILIWPTVMLPHIFLFIAGVTLYVLEQWDIIHIVRPGK